MDIVDYTQTDALAVPANPWLRRYTKLLVAAVLFLIFAGSLVTSTGSGLSVPDWPNTYGYFMFSFPLAQMVGGIFYEHSHRLIASTVGFLTIILAVWVACADKRRWLRVLALSALAVVVLQGVLGGVTVLFYLPLGVSLTHAVLAQTYFVLTVVIAYGFSKERRLSSLQDNRTDRSYRTYIAAVARMALAVAILVYLQLIFGALMRHTGSGLAIPDFPTMAGGYMPFFDEARVSWVNAWRYHHDLEAVTAVQLWIHFVHRAMAVLVGLSVLVVVLTANRIRKISPFVFWTAIAMLFVVLIQFVLGVVTVLSVKHYLVTGAHVATGAVLLGLSVLLVLRTWPVQGVRDKV